MLEPGQREYFYQRMLYLRHLRADDELLRIVEAIGWMVTPAHAALPAVAPATEPATSTSQPGSSSAPPALRWSTRHPRTVLEQSSYTDGTATAMGKTKP